MAPKGKSARATAARAIVISRVFAASRETVFQAWTDPKQVAQWWGPRGFTNPVCEWDARSGGAIHVVMRAPNGADYPMRGEFREVRAPERLVFTSGALDGKNELLFELLHTVTFVARNAKTALTIRTRVVRTTAGADRFLSGYKAGMSQSLERLADLMTDRTGREIVITRVFDAPRELVWEAWTNPEHVVRWWGPNGFTTTIQAMDVRPGGVWRLIMHGPDGTDYPNKSIFTEIVKPERIVYAHGGARKGGPAARFEATWTFEALAGNQTRLTMRSVFPSAADRDKIVREYGAIEGGKQTLARLAELLAKTPVIIERLFDAPVETVWRAITNPTQMRQWYFNRLESFKPEVGFQTEFTISHHGRDYPHQWKVTVVVPGKKLAYSWKFGGFPGDSLVTFELSTEGRKTRLKLTHAGLETFQPEANPDLKRGDFLQGWTQLIGTSLAGFLDKGTAAADREFVITRVFDAPREFVWRAWTDPAHLRRWFGPKGFTLPACSLDLRPGGVFHYGMRSPDGHEMWGKWIFREIVPPERLVVIASFSDANGGVTRQPLSATWPLETLSTLTLTEQEGRTMLTLRWAPHAATAVERQTFDSSHNSMQQGWTGTLDQLDAYLAEVRKGA